MLLIQQSDTAHPIDILMTSSTDHITPLTGATLTVTLSKNGAAFAAAAGTVAEIGSGIYKLTPTSADTGTLGELAIHATTTGADPSDLLRQIVAFNPYDLAALGLSRIDAAVSTRATPAQILTTPANLLATDATGRVTVGTNADKTGYALTAGEHTSIATDAQTGLTAQGYTTVRAGYLDTLNGLVAAIWASATRTLTALANVTVGGYASGQDPAALVLDPANGVLTGLSPRQALRTIFDVLTSTVAGAATTTTTIAKGGATIGVAGGQRVSATVDASGDRSAVTVDPT